LSVNFFKNGFLISPKKITYAKYNYNISAQTIFFTPFFYQYFTDGFNDLGCLLSDNQVLPIFFASSVAQYASSVLQ
jgi:hypothetical protein